MSFAARSRALVLQRLLSLVVAGSVVTATVPTWSEATAAAPRRRGKKKPKKAAAPATDGKTVALMRFTGPPPAASYRTGTQARLEERGYKIKSVALDMPAAAAKVKCRGGPDGDKCLEAIGKWLNNNPKTAADYIAFGTLTEDAGRQNLQIVIYDIGKKQKAASAAAGVAPDDQILPIALPTSVAVALDHHITPPPPVTDEEKQILAELDEPAKTPEEIAAEKQAIADAEKAAEEATNKVIDTGDIEVDLKKDFKAFCRKTKRKKRESRDDPKDLRPACKRGPFWGYWQPRAWVALSLASASLVTMGVFYGLALGARGPYRDAVDELDAFNDAVGGDPIRDPYSITNGGQSYDVLATEVSRTGTIMRRRAIVGDVLLGTTVLLTGVLAIIIFQDRSDAKKYIRQEKGLRAISRRLNVSPIVSRDVKGAGLHLRF